MVNSIEEYNKASPGKCSKGLDGGKMFGNQEPISKLHVKKSQSCSQYRGWAKNCSVK